MRNFLLLFAAIVLQFTAGAVTCGTVVSVTGNSLCFGDSLGSAVILPNTSPDPYWLTLNGSASQFYSVDSLSHLSPGNYQYAVSDSVSGCSDTGTFTISGPTAPLSATSTSNAVCAGAFGWAAVAAAGGTAPYLFLWSNGSTSSVQQMLSPGVYTVIVMDANGCDTVVNVLVPPLPPMSLSFNVLPATCNTCSDGSITVNVTGGSAPFTYNWGSTVSSGSSLSGIPPGVYQCCVTDAFGCVRCDSVACLGPGFQHITGEVFYDYDGNGVRDSGEAAAGNRWVLLMPDSLTAISSPISGQYGFYAQNGSYTDSLVVPAGWHTTTPSAYALNLTGSGASGIDFGLYPDQPNLGLATGILYPPAPRCLSQRAYTVRVTNSGWNAASGIISMTLDSQMTGISANPVADSVSGNTYYWHFNSLGIGQNVYFYLIAQLPAAGAVIQTGYSVYTFDSSGTSVLTDQGVSVQTVSCSFDPNDKAVNPPGTYQGAFVPDLVGEGAPLEYQIRFQNTGNDTAYAVVVRDTIDPELDLSTLEILGSSHDLTVNIGPDRVLVFTFNNIYLPDSFVDEPGSHGFIQYRLRPYSGTPVPFDVRNTAYIYFDQNAPVATNTTLSHYDLLASVGTPPTTADASFDFQVLPNPSSGDFIIRIREDRPADHRVQLMNLLGETVRDFGNVREKEITVKRDDLPAGVYFVAVDVSAGKSRYVKKLVLQ